MTIEKFSNSTSSDLTVNSHVASIEISHLLPDLDLGEFRKSLEEFNTEKLPYQAIYERSLVIFDFIKNGADGEAKLSIRIYQNPPSSELLNRQWYNDQSAIRNKFLENIKINVNWKELMAIPDNCKPQQYMRVFELKEQEYDHSDGPHVASVPKKLAVVQLALPDTVLEQISKGAIKMDAYEDVISEQSRTIKSGVSSIVIPSPSSAILTVTTNDKIYRVMIQESPASILGDPYQIHQLGCRYLIKVDHLTVLFLVDQPVRIFNEKWESVGETAAHFMGRMIKNSWNATSRGAKLVGDVVYFLALPDKFQKDDKGFSLKDLPGRLMRFNVKSPSIQEDELEQDVSDFDVNPKDKPDYAYISNSNQIHNGELVYDLSTQGVEFLTCILRIEKKFVVAGWIRKSNTAVYFALDHDFKNISMCSVANEQERTAPKGPVSQLAWTTLRTPEIQGLPIVIAGTTTGAINILALSKRKITLVANDYANKSTGNCSMSVLEHDGTIYIGGNSFFKKFRLKYTDTKT